MPPLVRMLSRTRPWLLAAAVAGLAAVPTAWWEQAPVICLFRRLFGVECLGCGLTRSVSYVLHGNLGLAAEYNRLGLVVAPAAVLAVCVDLGSRLLQRRSPCKC